VRKKLALVAALLAVALLAGACDAGTAGYAAQVNGATISQSTLASTLSEVSSNSGYTCELSSSGTLTVAGTATKTSGAGQSTYNSGFAAAVLDELIQLQAVRSELAARHLAVSSFADQEAVLQLQSELTPQSSATGASGTSGASCPGTGASILASFPTSYRDELIVLQAGLDVLAAAKTGFALTTAGVRGYLSRHGGLPQERCISVLATENKSGVQQAAAAIAHGASFASEARQHSLDAESAANGGAIGCVPNAEDSSLVAPLNTLIPKLKPGTVSSPVAVTTSQGQKYWLLVEVTAAKAVPLTEDAAADLPTLAEGEADIGSKLLAAERVVVYPSYGSWKKVSGVWEVVPPSGPPASLISNPAAVGATGASGVVG
jgi:hypothetical protein